MKHLSWDGRTLEQFSNKEKYILIQLFLWQVENYPK